VEAADVMFTVHRSRRVPGTLEGGHEEQGYLASKLEAFPH
jgi:hypothetical protein